MGLPTTTAAQITNDCLLVLIYLWLATTWYCAGMYDGLSCSAVPGLVRLVGLPGTVHRVRSVLAQWMVPQWSFYWGEPFRDMA
ncbi:hypothetical protein OI71_13855 [Aeromonas hydrophila]|nr:hypothetical protein OI71_13855 [Aeromonas hydrophila]